MKSQYDRKFVFKFIDLNKEGRTWKEIADLLNDELNLNLDESAYRKPYVSYRQGRLEGMSDDEFEALAEEKRRIRLERRLLTYERSINNEIVRDMSIKSILNEQARDAITKEPARLTFAKDVGALRDESEEGFVFVMSDFHYDGDENMLLALERVYAHIRLKQEELGFSQIKLVELGDTFDGGALRTSQLMAIKKGMVFQVIEIAKAYVELINRLREYMFVDFYCVTSSNHTQLRPLGTKQNQLIEEDLMHVFAEYIDLACNANGDINFNITYDIDLHFDVCGYAIFASHGHTIKNKEGTLEKIAFDRDLKIDYGFHGHYHHLRRITLYSGKHYNKQVIYVPSMGTKQSTFEKDRNLSSKPAIIMARFSKQSGLRYVEELFI